MAELKVGEPFGIDPVALDKIDWTLALARMVDDVRSDFIYAPHLSFIYHNAGDELAKSLIGELKSGSFCPGVPLTIEVPKSFRIQVKGGIKRLGPNFSRPGSILMPRDRLLYQALADEAVPIIQAKTDTKRSFSHQLAGPKSPSMFLPTRKCWSDLQKALSEHATSKSVNYLLKLDIANFFGSVNQHTLINILNDSGYGKPLWSRLEVMLTSYTGDRNSRGILQGLYPSDLFGNYYLAPIDRFMRDREIPAARYVDDIYIFVESVDSADRLMRELIPVLRAYDLVINEAKASIIPKAGLIAEEPDLEALFADAVAEISEQLDEDEFSVDYGFQSEWDEEEEEEEGLELKATMALFDSQDQYPGHEENIERFCLPLFSKAGSDYAVTQVLSDFKKRPAMAQIYASYLAKFLGNPSVNNALVVLLNDSALVDWQRLWVLAALSQHKPGVDEPVKLALDLLSDANRHEALRAAAAVYVGRFGDIARRKSLISIYPKVGSYIQAAIYFSSHTWPGAEKANAKGWAGHGPLHKLLTSAMTKKTST